MTRARRGALLLIALPALLACGGERAPIEVAPIATAAPPAIAAPPVAAPPAIAAPPAVAAPRAALVAGSCNWQRVVSICVEAVASAPGEEAAAFSLLKRQCKSVPTADPCPRANVAGSCKAPSGLIDRYYADGPRPYTAESARLACAQQHGRPVDIEGSD
jgi:hypothetical protein